MTEFFKEVSKINYEGKDSENPLAFKYYNPKEIVGDKTMEEHLRFAVAYWHTFNADGSDPFGMGTMQRPWNDIKDPMEKAKTRARAAFEFIDKLGVSYFCFHDTDVVPTGNSLSEFRNYLDEITDLFQDLMDSTGIKLLWGTSNMFSHPRFMNGAATSPNADVFAYSAAKVKKALEITNKLNGENYVFWGGREGYETLLNTNMALEKDNLARFLEMAVDYAKKTGFDGQFLIEPKPKEPTKHQYDFDAAAVLSFLEKYKLKDYFKLNIEGNHATLAGHTFQHELQVARINDALGSVDANQGDMLLGWDTDQYPTNINKTTMAMYEILKNGGLGSGGLNFDAKVRRASFEPVDLFYGHIAGMDAFARGLKVAHKLLEEGKLEDFITERYSSYEKGIGKEIVEGNVDFEDLEDYVLENDKIENASGRQEMLEAIVNQYLMEV
jgi:xylose isomerase